MAGMGALNLDRDYSLALLACAFRSGHAKLEKDVHVEWKSLMDEHATRRLKANVLEMATIFDAINLFGLPSGVDCEHLVKEGIVRLKMKQSDTIADNPQIQADTLRSLKSIVLPTALLRLNRTLRDANLAQLTRKQVSQLFDALGVKLAFGTPFNDVRLAFCEAWNLEGKSFQSLSKTNQDIVASIVMPALGGGFEGVPAIAGILAVMSECASIWNLIHVSEVFEIPFLSNVLSERAHGIVCAKAEDFRRTFQLCRIAMRDELAYSPVIDDLNDVLRLREDSRILRLRELLAEWCKLLPAGDIQVLGRIKSDIKKANGELRSLKKWRTVDRWLFWAQLPTTVIPILSTIVTLVSVGTHLVIEKKERNNWVAIGR